MIRLFGLLGFFVVIAFGFGLMLIKYVEHPTDSVEGNSQDINHT